MLSARQGWRPQDMLAVQKDVYSDFAHSLAQALLAAYDKRQATNPALTGAIAMLRGWNGQMEYSQPCPLLVTLAYSICGGRGGKRFESDGRIRFTDGAGCAR